MRVNGNPNHLQEGRDGDPLSVWGSKVGGDMKSSSSHFWEKGGEHRY